MFIYITNSLPTFHQTRCVGFHREKWTNPRLSIAGQLEVSRMLSLGQIHK
jgi:hypothetical protein